MTTHKPKAVGNLDGKDSVYDENGYRKVRVTFDTGAGESVTPPGEFEEFEIKQSEGSKRGWWYEGAHVDKDGNSVPIYNEGQREVSATTEEFQPRACVFQVAKVAKPLLSAAQVTKAGFLAILDAPDQASCLLQKKSGSKTKLKIDNGVYVLDLWVKKPGF